MITFHIVTAEPKIFPGILGTSLIGKSLGKFWQLKITNLRDFGIGKHKKIDERPVGGGPGLVIRPDVLAPAIDNILANNKIDRSYYLSPKGILLNQWIVKEVSKDRDIMLICGRFEGIDQRIIDMYNLIEISIGNYVLSNGDLAAMVLIDSIVRLIPGVVGNKESVEIESFSDKCFHDYPNFTKPLIYQNKEVPKILLSGNHKQITKWREEEIRLSMNKLL